MGQSIPEKIIKMDEFSAVNASMSGSTTVPPITHWGKRWSTVSLRRKLLRKIKYTTSLLQNKNCSRGEIEDKKFELTYNGNTVDFISKQPTDTDIGEGSATIVNSIQDEITYTIDKSLG
mgnify:CR=1 FL=1